MEHNDGSQVQAFAKRGGGIGCIYLGLTTVPYDPLECHYVLLPGNDQQPVYYAFSPETDSPFTSQQPVVLQRKGNDFKPVVVFADWIKQYLSQAADNEEYLTLPASTDAVIRDFKGMVKTHNGNNNYKYQTFRNFQSAFPNPGNIKVMNLKGRLWFKVSKSRLHSVAPFNPIQTPRNNIEVSVIGGWQVLETKERKMKAASKLPQSKSLPLSLSSPDAPPSKASAEKSQSKVDAEKKNK